MRQHPCCQAVDKNLESQHCSVINTCKASRQTIWSTDKNSYCMYQIQGLNWQLIFCYPNCNLENTAQYPAFSPINAAVFGIQKTTIPGNFYSL